MIGLLAALTLALAPAKADLTLNPNLRVFGPGPFINAFENDQALTNASAHLGWSIAVPVLARHYGGHRAEYIAGGSWIVLTLVQESLFHAPLHPDPQYSSEVRTDLLTRIVPCAAILLIDWLRDR